MEYKVKYKKNIVEISELFKHYQPIKVEGYCSNCPNYDRIWSCPPHDFSVEEYLREFSHVLVIGAKVTPNEGEAFIDVFQIARRNLGDKLLEVCESDDVDVLIAGNCYQCETCEREIGNKCIKDEKMKYSLESLGFLVSGVTENILGEQLQWKKSGKNPKHLLTVGVIFSKSEEKLKEIELSDDFM